MGPTVTGDAQRFFTHVLMPGWVIRLYLLTTSMREREEINCNCFAMLTHPDKQFLARRKDKEDRDSPKHSRNTNQPEVKYESEPKHNKKSLKKRPLSFKQTDSHAYSHHRSEEDHLIPPPQRALRAETSYLRRVEPQSTPPVNFMPFEAMSVRHLPSTFHPQLPNQGCHSLNIRGIG